MSPQLQPGVYIIQSVSEQPRVCALSARPRLEEESSLSPVPVVIRNQGSILPHTFKVERIREERDEWIYRIRAIIKVAEREVLDNVRARQDQDKVCRVYAYMDQPPQEWIIKNREQNEYMIIQHEGREQKNRNAWTVPQSPDREEQIQIRMIREHPTNAQLFRFERQN